MAGTDDQSPHSGEDFLDANRKNRAKARDAAEREAARKTARTPGKVETPRRSVAGALADRWGATRTVAVLLALCAALALGSVGLAAWAVHSSQVAAQTDPQSAHGRDAMTTARTYVASVMTYDVKDYADLDRRIREISTTDFAEKFIESSAQARKANTAAGASSKATAPTAGFISLTKDRAQVLVALDQTITAPEIAAELPDGHLYQSRVQVTLVRDDDRWLLDDLQVV
ncbi:MAG TPA: hypothetical protein PK331_05210 [Gordonia sp. (in: high G+C Gram-positive bacteria)]|uniref:hypothetical protein n=1 Tax=unclassified Gordonia (in: high G+C Gram-positive bacteria) TaxID=2657482 RepID=UPI000F9027B3|nr:MULTISPECIES: hypothetical protein [unclassified Gordonia (in: high G+C Gram-positive bacteria)]RUP41551.1 MAG: hypothetical protein EKK60_00580 [Gordonia sp. (in: high G+C Gram-positive bacteria)]HNP56639.1 hypothetical protein [Gordonia sp. (in: high G+C Gram-positive bacteria)]HRC50309.1 hypothetical protein [Gordonia sp. (in: high G+C Gram-positive bacteria)]